MRAMTQTEKATDADERSENESSDVIVQVMKQDDGMFC